MSTLPAFWNPELKTRLPADSRSDGRRYVSESEYWEKYYHFSDKIYEWNNGYLEEKGVSDFETVSMADWFSGLISLYFNTRPIGKKVFLEMAFTLFLAGKKEIRRPDLAIVLDTNPVPLPAEDETYKGVYDLCIEAVSRSNKTNIQRDTVDKKAAYARGGVQEYFILDGRDRYMEFYRLNARGVYVPIKAAKDGVIQSQVLPGFQFRKQDLFTKPVPEAMAEDPVYQAFVMPAYRQARQEAEERAEKAERRADKLAAQLRALGIEPEDL